MPQKIHGLYGSAVQGLSRIIQSVGAITTSYNGQAVSRKGSGKRVAKRQGEWRRVREREGEKRDGREGKGRERD